MKPSADPSDATALSRRGRPRFEPGWRGAPERLRIGVVGTYGTGNLGDEAIFLAFLQWLHRNAPQVTPVPICVNPSEIESSCGLPSHGVSAYHAAQDASAQAVIPQDAGAQDAVAQAVAASPPMASATVLATAGASSAPAPAEPAALNELAAPAGDGASGRSRLQRALDVLERRWPAAARLLRSTRQLGAELRAIGGYFPRQLALVRSLDAVIVLGGGQVHDFWGGPLGHPATLFLWALAARLTHRPHLIASLGAVDLGHRASRWFVRTVFRWSDYASVRDAPTAAVVRSLGLPDPGPIVPDLAWGLRPSELVERPGARAGEAVRAAPRVVGVCPMVWRHPQLWPAGDADAYARYVEALGAFCSRLVREGHEVVLFPTQVRSDGVAIRDVAARIDPALMGHVRICAVEGVEQLLECLAGVDAVVSSRFHGLLLALLMGRPAMSVSYQEKNDALLAELGERHLGLDIHRVTPEALWSVFATLREEYAAYAGRLGPHRERNRQRLEEQYRAIFDVLGWDPPGPAAQAAVAAP